MATEEPRGSYNSYQMCYTDSSLHSIYGLSCISGTTTILPGDCPYCLNGGTLIGGNCQCLQGYTGVYCEKAISQPLGMYTADAECVVTYLTAVDVLCVHCIV